jgi:hypothetical protein
MAFPVSPADGTIYTTALGSRYKYYSADGKWVKDGLVPSTLYGVTGTISFVLDGGGAAVATGAKGDIMLPYNIAIDSWYLTARETGSIQIGLWRDSYANYPPTSAKAMHTGATGPYINAGIKNTATTAAWGAPTGASQEFIRVNVDSASSVGQVSMNLNYHKI